MIALISLLMMADIDPDACKTASAQCREATAQAILKEEHRADTWKNAHSVCIDRVAARTSTAVGIVGAAAQRSMSTPTSGYSLETVIAVAAIAVVVAGALGYALHKPDDPQTIVVR